MSEPRPCKRTKHVRLHVSDEDLIGSVAHGFLKGSQPTFDFSLEVRMLPYFPGWLGAVTDEIGKVDEDIGTGPDDDMAGIHFSSPGYRSSRLRSVLRSSRRTRRSGERFVRP